MSLSRFVVALLLSGAALAAPPADPTAIVQGLFERSAQRQLLEIVKAMSLDARLVIMDEPTSSLTITETERLMRVIAGALKGQRLPQDLRLPVARVSLVLPLAVLHFPLSFTAVAYPIGRGFDYQRQQRRHARRWKS
jgi:hypothetical protein